MGLFGFGKSAVEKRLIETYSVSLQPKFGSEARATAKEFVQMARQQAEADGTLDLDYDKYMRFAEAAPGEKKRLAAKRKDGVTDDDLQLWWGLHDLERRMLGMDEDNSRIAFFMAKKQAGLSAEQAALEMRKAMAIYGDPLDAEITSGDDRPLPDELKDRVNRWLDNKTATGDGAEIRKLAESFSSFNALIRSEIRAGHV